MVARVLALVLAAAVTDGGTPDGGDAGADELGPAGIYRVTRAIGPACEEDAGPCTLGPGWWLSSERMLKTGSKLVELKNENAQLQAAAADTGWFKAALIGFGIGLAAGVGTMAWLVSKR